MSVHEDNRVEEAPVRSGVLRPGCVRVSLIAAAVAWAALVASVLSRGLPVDEKIPAWVFVVFTVVLWPLAYAVLFGMAYSVARMAANPESLGVGPDKALQYRVIKNFFPWFASVGIVVLPVGVFVVSVLWLLGLLPR
jgi:hypothetical protein